MKSSLTPERALLFAMLFFIAVASVWAFRVPLVNGIPISFNPDEPSHFLVIRYISAHWALPPYTMEYYESAHPPLSDFIYAAYMRLWPLGTQVYALRFLSIGISLVSLVTIYRTGLLLVSRWAAVFAAALVAALPMFIILSSSVTNDPLAVLICCLGLFWITKCLTSRLSKKELNLLCVIVGLAGITKYTCLGLVPISVAAIVYERRKSHWVVPAISVLASFILISGWWYLRNDVLYGDVLRMHAEADMHSFTGGGNPGSPGYWILILWTLAGSTLGAYPSFPEWPPALYDTLTAMFGIVLIAGLVVQVKGPWRPAKIALAAFAATVLAAVLMYQVNHFQPHGRLLYPAVTVLALGLAGLRHVVPAQNKASVAILTWLGVATLSVAMIATASFT